LFVLATLHQNLISRGTVVYTRGMKISWRAFTLLELIVTIAIICVLLAMSISAIQQVRESASRLSCQNNLKQLGLATWDYIGTHGRFPDGGIQTRYTEWECGWLYRIRSGWEGPNPPQWGLIGNVPQKILFCPSRRVPSNDDFGPAGNDYAGNVGTNMDYGDWAPSNAAFVWARPERTNGLIAPRPYTYWPYHPLYGDGPGVMLTQVSAGMSNTLLTAEKRMDALLVGKRQWGEGNDWTWGCGDWQTVRVTSSPPQRDWRDGKPLTGWGSWDKDGSFGSAHSVGLNCLAGDGSVRFISYSVDPQRWQDFGNRNRGWQE
jgi:prepilin-type N-terminal cleavage/methylation domain-containing protein